ALRREIYAAVERWFEGCFKMPIPLASEVVEKLEEYYVRCEVTKAVRGEFGPDAAPGYWARDGFWWDGELMGKPLSCFIRWHKAFCKWGNATWHFKVAEAEDGVYIKPDTPLVDRWIKVAHRGEYEIGN
ncbi:PaRep2a protein, partial [Pyrobaculum sp.]|uniref:PaRep2a protein n=1 Tax=Pyrobaculum sp. TaxID=2004705 RepID=UPI00316B6291